MILLDRTWNRGYYCTETLTRPILTLRRTRRVLLYCARISNEVKSVFCQTFIRDYVKKRTCYCVRADVDTWQFWIWTWVRRSSTWWSACRWWMCLNEHSVTQKFHVLCLVERDRSLRSQYIHSKTLSRHMQSMMILCFLPVIHALPQSRLTSLDLYTLYYDNTRLMTYVNVVIKITKDRCSRRDRIMIQFIHTPLDNKTTYKLGVTLISAEQHYKFAESSMCESTWKVIKSLERDYVSYVDDSFDLYQRHYDTSVYHATDDDDK